MPQIKKKRQTKRDADETNSDNRKPDGAHAEARAFGAGKANDHDGRDDHIHPEKSADPVGKKLVQEERPIEAMLENPRHELGIG